MPLSIRKVGDVVIMDFSGRLELGAPVEEFRRAIQQQLGAGVRKFVWNLGNTAYIDSAALGALVTEQLAVRNQGGEVKLVVQSSQQSEGS